MDVGLDGLGGMEFEQREVLERRGVEHHVGAVPREHLLHAFAIAYVGDDEVLRVEKGAAFDGHLNGVQGRFVPVDHDEGLGAEPVELAAEFGPDRSAGTGDEHPPTGDVVRDRLDVGVDLVTAEEVGLGEGPDVVGPHVSVDQLGDRRDDPDGDVRFEGSSGQLAQRLTRDRGRRDDEHLRPDLAGCGHDLIAVAQDGDSADAEVALVRIVVDEPQRVESPGGIRLHRADDLAATVTGAEDEDRRALLLRPSHVA